ncbi:hypothetical protein [Nonomuraea sp. B19D2]|uniref:hypothetical protein n=1 Tax=Nonomuraea sp. B19D2 TaxID=3159561 RepID=UPI0032DBB3A1
MESFAQMMADLDGQRLPAWLKQAEATDLPPLKSLVNGICHYLAAVTAGLAMGASFDLLRLQILHAD